MSEADALACLLDRSLPFLRGWMIVLALFIGAAVLASAYAHYRRIDALLRRSSP